MPDYADLVVLVSGIRTNDKKMSRAITACGHLVDHLAGEHHLRLTERQQLQVTRRSAKRLHRDYIHKLQFLGMQTKEAAQAALDAEIARLESELLPKQPPS